MFDKPGYLIGKIKTELKLFFFTRLTFLCGLRISVVIKLLRYS